MRTLVCFLILCGCDSKGVGVLREGVVTGTYFTSAPWSALGTETYASTNRFMQYGIELNDAAFNPLAPHGSYTALMGQYNYFPDPEWNQINFQPAIEAMQAWSADLFANRGTTGLLPMLYTFSPRRFHDAATNTWARALAPGDGDSRLFALVDNTYASSLGALGRMYDFLSWFPTDTTLRASCLDWAAAVARVNSGSAGTPTDMGGHFVSAGGYALYNYVQVGLPYGTTLAPTDAFEKQLRYATEGMPGTLWTQSGLHGIVAMSFEKLSALSGDSTWSTHARRITDGVWSSRFNRTIYIFPDTFTRMGPTPGDQEGAPNYRYQYDSDSLYWVNALYKAYGATGSSWVGGWPSDGALSFVQRANNRRSTIDTGIAGSYPARYLYYALGATVDWVRFGWDDPKKQFVRKIFHDGTHTTPSLIYADAKINTLRMLVQGYQFTHDGFYLDLFEAAWNGLYDPTATITEDTTLPGLLLRRTIPSQIQAGAVPAGTLTDASQDVYLAILVDAYRASRDAGAPRPSLYNKATAFAGELQDRVTAHPDWAGSLYQGYNGIAGSAYMRLARAPGTLRRITLNLLASGETLTFRQGATVLLTLPVSQLRAVVYMDDGSYTITSSAGGPPLNYVVSADATITAPF
jgi:hypothetical protein